MRGTRARDIFADTGEPHEETESPFRAVRPSRRGDIMVRLPYEARQKLRLLALEEDTTVQALMEEAINLLMERYKQDPLV